MDEKELLLRFFMVVAKGLRHKHYKHVVEKRTKYMQLVAGVGLDKLLRQYVRREDKKLFQQRVTLTQHIVTAICKNLLDPFYKVPRSNSGRRILTHTGNDGESKTTDLEKILTEFWGDESWDDYMSTRSVELNAIDPNSFTVFEFKPFDAEKEPVKPYPFEVSCEDAIDFKLKNKILEYLIARNTHSYKATIDNGLNVNTVLQNTKETHKKGYKYTLYGKNKTWQLLQVDEKTVPSLAVLKEGEVVRGTKTIAREGAEISVPANYVRLGRLFYEFVEFLPHNCDVVPAFRPGYYRDLQTNGETYVSPLHPAQPYLEKSIKVNSELDLVATLIAFPQMIRYGQKCQDDKCYEGYYDDGKECGTCQGTGVKATAPSAQDAITIKMPDSKEQMIPLNDLVKYLSPEVDIVKWQEDYIDKLTFNAKRIMFNSDIFDRKQIADTATGKFLDMQNVYDTLHPFAVKFSKTWKKGVQVMAKLADREEGLVASYSFGKDFKLKSLDTLIVDLKNVNGIGNPTLVQHINDDIAQIIFSEKPIEMQRYAVKEMYNVFRGKSEKEIQLLLAGDLVSRRDKVLHANYGRIFDELELKYVSEGNSKNFYKLNRTEQRKAIYEMVDEIIIQLDEENPEPKLELE